VIERSPPGQDNSVQFIVNVAADFNHSLVLQSRFLGVRSWGRAP
jgi:hypothetical protein